MESTEIRNVKVFTNEEFGSLRVMDVNGEPYFVGRDVAYMLGYVKPFNAVDRHVDREDTLKQDIEDNLGRMQETIIINESGLYSLILSSKLNSAKKFKRWVTSQVLPSIRKTGSYNMSHSKKDCLLLEIIHADTEVEKALAVEEYARYVEQPLLATIEEQKPKVDFYDNVLHSSDLVPISIIAKEYGITAISLNRYLKEKKIHFRKCGQWLLYDKYAQMGLTGTRTCLFKHHDDMPKCVVHTYWTQKGRKFIYDLLKAEGVLPISERYAN